MRPGLLLVVYIQPYNLIWLHSDNYIRVHCTYGQLYMTKVPNVTVLLLLLKASLKDPWWPLFSNKSAIYFGQKMRYLFSSEIFIIFGAVSVLLAPIQNVAFHQCQPTLTESPLSLREYAAPIIFYVVYFYPAIEAT